MRHCHSAVAVTAIVGAIVAVGLLRADLDPVQPMGCGRTLRQRDCASVAQPDSSSAFERQRIDFLDMLIVLNFRLRTDDTLPGLQQIGNSVKLAMPALFVNINNRCAVSRSDLQCQL